MIDRRIAPVPQLVTVVLESLTEVVQQGPRFVASGARQAVLARKRRNTVGLLYARQEKCQRKQLQPDLFQIHSLISSQRLVSGTTVAKGAQPLTCITNPNLYCGQLLSKRSRALFMKRLPIPLGVCLWNKLVSHSINSAEKCRTLRIALDLLSQFRDAVIHGAIAGTRSFWPQGTDQPSARHDNFRPGDEEFQDLELLQREAHRLIGAREFHLSEIQKDLSKVRTLINSPDGKIGHIPLRG